MTRLLALYPRTWRERYESELRSLLNERPPSRADRFDLVRGAFDAHRHPELVEDAGSVSNLPAPEDLVIARRLGFAGIAGAGAWALAWLVVATAPLVTDPYGSSYRQGEAAFPILILAGALLVAGICGQLIALPRTARLARAGAIVAIPGILLWTLVPWFVWTAAVALLGLAVLAYGGWFARAWPWQASVALLLMVAAMPFIAYLGVNSGPIGADWTPTLALFVATPFVAWLTIGGTLLGRRPDDVAAA